MLTKKQWEHCLAEMDRMFPEAHCELVHENPFELTIATLLSAQCTDVLVNKVTKTLFQKYLDASHSKTACLLANVSH